MNKLGIVYTSNDDKIIDLDLKVENLKSVVVTIDSKDYFLSDLIESFESRYFISSESIAPYLIG